MRSTRRSRLQAWCRRITILAVALSLCGLVSAGDRPVPAEKRTARVQEPARKSTHPSRFAPFAREKILPRIGVQLQALTAFGHAEPDRDITDQALFEEMSRDVRRGVERAAKRAVKDYLIEVTDVESLVDRLRDRRRSASGPVEPAGDRRRLRFDVGFHRMLPEVEMRYGVGRGSFRFSMDAEGAVSVRYRDDRMTSAKIVAGFDGDDTYRLGLRVDF